MRFLFRHHWRFKPFAPPQVEKTLEYFSMCQRDINRFLHEPFLAIRLVRPGRMWCCMASAECCVWDPVRFSPPGAAFLTGETTTDLFENHWIFLCLCSLLKSRLHKGQLLLNCLLLLLFLKREIIKCGVDVGINICFYQQVIAEEINVCVYQIHSWLKCWLFFFCSIGQRKMNLPN